NLNPRELFAANVRQSSDGTRYVSQIAAHEAKKARQGINDQTPAYMHHYYENILSGRRITHQLHLLKYDRAQFIADTRVKRAKRREEQTWLELIPTTLYRRGDGVRTVGDRRVPSGLIYHYRRHAA